MMNWPWLWWLVLQAVPPAVFCRATVSPVSERWHGQWNVALTELDDGRVLAAWEAGTTETRTANAVLVAVSGDGGRSWGEPAELAGVDERRCTPCGWYRFGTALHWVYAELPLAGHGEPCRVLDRASTDDGRTWSEPRELWRTAWGVAMQPVVLSDGRIALPVYERADKAGGGVESVARVLVSADGGASFVPGPAIRRDAPGGVTEPALAETTDGEWLCVCRTSGTSRLLAARSSDGGRTWSELAALPLESPASIARLLRLHDGSLVVVWNGVGSTTMAPRNPLTAARSTDGGRSWPERRDLLPAQPGAIYSNHGVTQLRSGVVLVAYQDFHRDPDRAPERGGVDSVELVGFDLAWLAGR